MRVVTLPKALATKTLVNVLLAQGCALRLAK